jgi:tetratricopeptide (TPR) repeat protein
MRLSAVVSFLILSSFEPLMAQNSYLRLGKQAYLNADYKEAVSKLEKANSIDSTNANALYMLGYSYYHSDNYPKSISAFTKYLNISPADGWAYYYRGRAKMYVGKDLQLQPTEREKYFVGAILDLTKAISINPGDTKITSFYQTRAIAYRDYGIFKLQANLRGTYDKIRGIDALKASIADLEKILAADPNRSDIATQLDLSKEKLASALGHR